MNGFNADGIVPEFLLSKINYSQPVRIGWTMDDPLATECFDTYGYDCPLPGYEVEYCYTIIHGILKMDYELVKFDSYENMSAGLGSGDIDIVGLSYFVDEDMADLYGWAPVYLWDGTALIARQFDKPTDDTLLLLQAFTYDLWIAMVLITFVSLLIRYMSKKLYKERKKNNMPLSRFSYIVYVFRAKLVYVLWFLLLGILLNFYGNVFAVNILTSSKEKMRAFTDFTDLGHKLISGECKLTIYDAYIGDNEFHGTIINPNRHNASWAPLFRQAYQMHKPDYYTSRDIMMDHILSEPCTVGLDWWTMETFFTSKWCNVEVVMYPEERETYYQYTYYTTRDDIRDAVYSVISSSSFQSFINYLGNKYYQFASPPACRSIAASGVDALDISKLQDGVYVWLVGLAMALTILIYQKIKHRHDQVFGKQKSVDSSLGGSFKKRVGTVGPEHKTDISTQMTPEMERRRTRTNYQLYF